MIPLTDFPQRFKTTEHVFLNLADQMMEKMVESAVVQQNRVILKLSGIDSPEQARQFRGALLQVTRDKLWPLEDGVYYQFEIIGLQVVTVDGSVVGEVTEVLTTGGNDVYVVKNRAGQERLIPAIRSIIKQIDTEAGRMVIEPTSGLLERE